MATDSSAAALVVAAVNLRRTAAAGDATADNVASFREGIVAVAGEYDPAKWHKIDSPDLDPDSPHADLFWQWHELTDWLAEITDIQGGYVDFDDEIDVEHEIDEEDENDEEESR